MHYHTGDKRGEKVTVQSISKYTKSGAEERIERLRALDPNWEAETGEEHIVIKCCKRRCP